MQVKTDIPITITRIKKHRNVTYLLTVGSDAKTIRGEIYGYRTGIMYLLPAKGSEIINVCKHASPECIRVCLNTAGRGQFNSTQLARLNRTILFTSYKHEFWYMLVKNIEALKRDAVRRGLIPVIRLNGLSDIPWEKVKIKGTQHDGLTIFQAYPELIFYDYSKYPYHERETLPQNYHLTYSYSEKTTPEIFRDNLDNGRNVAVVFNVCEYDNKGKHFIKCTCPLPNQWRGYDVISGDDSDIRFNDPQGVIVGLHAKGEARFVDSGFVIKPD